MGSLNSFLIILLMANQDLYLIPPDNYDGLHGVFQMIKLMGNPLGYYIKLPLSY
jgi:hypothetical protein